MKDISKLRKADLLKRVEALETKILLKDQEHNDALWKIKRERNDLREKHGAVALENIKLKNCVDRTKQTIYAAKEILYPNLILANNVPQYVYDQGVVSSTSDQEETGETRLLQYLYQIITEVA